MLRKGSEAVSEGNGPAHQEEEFGFGQSALTNEYREIRSLSKQQEIRLDKITRKKNSFQHAWSIIVENICCVKVGEVRYILQ